MRPDVHHLAQGEDPLLVLPAHPAQSAPAVQVKLVKSQQSRTWDLRPSNFETLRTEPMRIDRMCLAAAVQVSWLSHNKVAQ